jgi:hypothetical protein
MQYSIAISDAVLAAVCLWAFLRLVDSRFVLSAVPGFALVGAAALLGVARYALLPELKPAHGIVSTMAGWVGMPLLGFAFILATWRAYSRRVQIGVIFALVIMFVLFAYVVPFKLYGTLIGGLAMVVVLASGIKDLSANRNFAFAAVVGSVLVIFVGLFVRGEGEWGGVLRVNWYHYGLALAMGALAFALIRKRL